MLSKNFRYDISFLRVIAVFAVVLFHYNIPFFEGGFIGVDIFFVISGYLMTKIILNGFSNNNFSLLDFYKRRVVRIIPALLVMILLFCICIYFLIPTQIINYFNSAFSSSLFFSNIYYYLNSGYFDESSHRNFLLHTWSLSVEWQFYMVFPLLLLFAKNILKLSIKYYHYYILGLACISFLLMIYHNQEAQDYSFYITYTRSWEMLIGGIAFINGEKIRNYLGKINIYLSLVLYSILFYYIIKADSTQWPSYNTLIVALSTTLLLCLNTNFSFYKNKIIKYLGDLSYSLYLYHWPIYVISLFFDLNIRLLHKIEFILLSIIISIISYEVIEKRKFNKYSLSIALTSMIYFALFYTFSKVDPVSYMGNIGNLAKATTQYKNSDDIAKQYHFKTKNVNIPTYHLREYMTIQEYDFNHLKIDTTRKNIVLLGDRHAGMFSKSMFEICKKNNWHLIQITADATFPMPNSKGNYQGPRDLFNIVYKEYFPKNYNYINLMVISSNYQAYDNNEIADNINSIEDYFQKYNIPTLYIGQTDSYPLDYPTMSYMQNRYNLDYIKDRWNTPNQIAKNNFYKELLDKKYLDLKSVQINKVSKEKVPYIYDSNHLNYFGTQQYKSILEDKIHQINLTSP